MILREVVATFLAARSSASCSEKPICPGIHTKITDDLIEVSEEKVIWMS